MTGVHLAARFRDHALSSFATYTPYTRYNRLSNRLNNRLNNPTDASCKETFNQLFNRFDNWLNVCLHDAAGCSTTVVKPPAAVEQPLFNRLNITGWMFGYTIQPVVQPVVQPVIQPVWQLVVSCERGVRIIGFDRACTLHRCYDLYSPYCT